MKPTRTPTVLVICLSIGSQVCAAATMDFDSLAVGTAFGGPPLTNVPGDVVHTEDGIDMSVETFFFTAQNFEGFVRAEVVGSNVLFPSNHMELDNINLGFDLAQVGFNVNQVSVEYVELGGLNNFSINGGTIIEITPLTGLPANIGGVAVSQTELDPVTHRTRITLTGEIDSFLIGGQELAVDTIIAIPEPATLVLLGICGAVVLWRGSRRLTRAPRAA